ncbi:hypothetical protein BK754_03180 [Bacillus thuringiensis serovar subtoxicus]|uniref:Uncharacterized protein n=1 Tax=Bacillus thuringiensis serovar subtoxicus TaxID=475791 RepID=A0A9X6FS85_BACTU|nr:hypothetical protein BK754_03180 [Bacillus thuringiensis serovar subtoxicus]
MSIKPNNKFFSKKTMIIIPILLLCAFAFHYFFLTSNQAFSGTGDALRMPINLKIFTTPKCKKTLFFLKKLD